MKLLLVMVQVCILLIQALLLFPLLLNLVHYSMLHVPHMKNNLISVSQLCKTNKVFFEFSPSHFLVKDSSTGTPLVKGLSMNNLYVISPQPSISSSIATELLSVNTPVDICHQRLGHPSSHVLSHLVKTFNLSFGSLHISISDS